jgi:hypothetical protein
METGCLEMTTGRQVEILTELLAIALTGPVIRTS